MHKNILNIKPNTVIIDSDTILYTAAKALQEDYILIRHKVATTWTKEFAGVQKFYGTKKTRDEGWIGEQNAKRDEDKKISYEDFSIEPMARVVQEDFIAWGRFNHKIEDIMVATKCDDFRIVIGGQGNFRYDIAQIQPYKADRPDKPIKYLEVREYVEKKYADKIIVVNDIEADDVVSSLAHDSFKHFNKTGKHLYTLAYVDKDLNMCICPYLNYNKIDEGVHDVTPFEAAKCFCTQMLTGDSVDTILGLPNFSPDICEKYSIRKTRGIGKATAYALLDHASTIKELFEFVVEAYKSYYGTEEFDFKSFRDVTTKRTWFDMLEENCQLLYMRREHNTPYDLKTTLTKLGVEM